MTSLLTLNKHNTEPKTLNFSKHSALRTLTLLAIAGTSLSLVTGCHKKNSGIDPSSLGPTNTTDNTPIPAPTATITADPLAIDLGQTVVLNWRTMNASSVSIDGIGQVNVNGTQTVSPSNSTNFHLVAKGDGGTTEANVRVTVRTSSVPVGGTTSGLDAAANGGNVTDAAFHAAVQDVFFDYDSIELRPDGQTAAVQAATYMSQHPNLHILVGGYCDERGSAEYNLALGENRANAAKTALVNAGVAANRIRTISYGKEKQFCTEANEACWQQNRRAQFSIDR
ncbi:OmpA family protein [Granulicella tundricola]|uniref:Peptidoglycan-associated protein n=1 Tax=Granulicella tundricola (strain ATCC BAA-1859 / DSM 23138 / MP5ACTX9) TaxID=1198114 RepID=E8WXM1_GRATM|nr:OmpA family protein [Granulicella tundricola]ADW68637.1 OmpA/MotB domain protein [Granulicella tundricola MP5ACTX9]